MASAPPLPYPPSMPDDPAHDRITRIVAAITGLVSSAPNLVGFDFADLRAGLIEGGRAVFAQGEVSGSNRAIRAADGAIAGIRNQLRRQ